MIFKLKLSIKIKKVALLFRVEINDLRIKKQFTANDQFRFKRKNYAFDHSMFEQPNDSKHL